jgi:hypothetical protein
MSHSTEPTLASLSEQLTKLSASVTSQMKEINDIYAQMAKLVVTPAEPELTLECFWCRDNHLQKDCHHDKFMTAIGASRNLWGVFETKTVDGIFWVFAFPIKKYPILIGYRGTGTRIQSLDFFAGQDYGKAGFPVPEIFTKHEFQVIKDNDPKLAEWVAMQKLHTTD